METSVEMTGKPPRDAGLTGRHAECAGLDQLINTVRAGGSRVLVVRGDPGAGKSALLDYLAEHASGCQVLRAVGVQSEMELAYAGLHQLLAPVLHRVDLLPTPQREALRTAFGVSAGPVPDQFLVGLAVLGLVSEAAAERPLVCLVDDEHWLDRASVQALGFVARRLAADPVGLVFAAREAGAELAGLPELMLEGLAEDHAQALLESALTGPLDRRIRNLIVAESRGNPLALLELPRGLSPDELAGGFGLPGRMSLPRRIEESFRRQLHALPEETRRLLQLAAADPTGDVLLVWRAAGRLGITVGTGTPASAAGLVEFGARLRFRHPLVRSAAYQSASPQEMRQMHAALAQVTDPAADPDRRAWHLAQAAPGPDEDIAAELERSAARAQERGGLAATAAFMERAALLTPGPMQRSQRLLAASEAKLKAGAPDAALALLDAAEAGPPDAWQAAKVESLRGQIAFNQDRHSDAARLLLSAARHLDSLDAALAREIHLVSLMAAMSVNDLGRPGGMQEAAEAALVAPPCAGPPRPVDVLLDALALWMTQGHAAAAATLARAVELHIAHDADCGPWLPSALFALELWDWQSWHVLAARKVQSARDRGALIELQDALNFLAGAHLFAGELRAAERLLDEEHLTAEATGNPRQNYTAMILAAYQGRDQVTRDLIDTVVRKATEGGSGRLASEAAYASAVLHNGRSQHGTARDVAWELFERDELAFGPLIIPELAEAAARTGEAAAVTAALDWMSERTRARPNDWMLGIEAQIRALLSDGEGADSCYQKSIERLSRTPIRPQLARTRLLYGEWLRRQGRRMDAREQLRAACDMLEAMGMEAFAERARRELLATGETVRKRTAPAAGAVVPGEPLTAQEAQVARLAGDGLSNPEIGARLFLSPRTVKYHLSKVFTKLDITSRGQLHRVLPDGPNTARPR